jgi:hypothetical protein
MHNITGGPSYDPAVRLRRWRYAGPRTGPTAAPLEAIVTTEPDPEPAPIPEPPAAAPVAAEIPADLLRVLEAVTTMCDHVIEYIETDRAERRLMIEILGKLADRLAEAPAIGAPVTVPALAGERVIGGSLPAGPDPAPADPALPVTAPEPPVVDPAPRESTTPPATAAFEPANGQAAHDGLDGGIIDLREADTAVEVRCRFGDRWVDGFEICDVLSDDTGVRYRLRRRIDGFVLPELFHATDIRHVETFAELQATPAQQRRWSAL